MGNQAGRRTNARTSEDGIENNNERGTPDPSDPEPSGPMNIPGQSRGISASRLQPRPDTPRTIDQRNTLQQGASVCHLVDASEPIHRDAESQEAALHDQPASKARHATAEPLQDDNDPEARHRQLRIRQQRALAYVLARGEFMDEPQQSKAPASSGVVRAGNVSSWDAENLDIDDVFHFSFSPKSEHIEYARPPRPIPSSSRQDENQMPTTTSTLESHVKDSAQPLRRITSKDSLSCPGIHGSNARQSLERLLQQNVSTAHKSESRDAELSSLSRPRRRHNRSQAVDLRAASSLLDPVSKTDRGSDQSSGNSQEGSGSSFVRRPRALTFNCGSMPMKREEPSAATRGRGRPAQSRVRFADMSSMRVQSAAPKLESRSGTQSKGMPLEELINMMADQTRASFESIQGEATPTTHYAAERRMREAAIQDLASPSAYELMSPEVQSRVHPMDLPNDQRPWPWNTQPEKLPFGVAANSIQGLNNIGWVCQGAERLAADLNDGTDESAFAVEQARNKLAKSMLVEQQKNQRRAERRRLTRQLDTTWRGRQHSLPVTRNEKEARLTQGENVKSESRYETIYARDGRPVRFPKTSESFADDETDRITSSVPLHYQLLDGRTEQPPLLLIRTRTARQLPQSQSRNRSQGPPHDSPRPPARRSLHFSLDGACDVEFEASHDFYGLVDTKAAQDPEILFSDNLPQAHCRPLVELSQKPHTSRSGVNAPFGDDGMSPSLSLGYLNSAAYSNNGSMPSQNMVRQAPSPQGPAQQGQMQQQQQQQQQQPQAAQQQANGMNGGANSAAALQASLGHTGHQPDFNYLWGVVQELTEALAHNRAQTASIISGVQRIQARSREEGGELPTAQQVNGELAHASEIADLQNRLHEMTRERDDYAAQHNESIQILTDYERTMDSLMIKIRDYASNHAKAIIGVHQHYEAQLAAEREANLQLRIEHGQWQAGLGKATELARMALRQRSKETSGLEAGLREVKAENRVLRKIAGWEVEDSSDDEDSLESNLGVKLSDGGPMRPAPSVPGL